jgi:hypothetical protein
MIKCLLLVHRAKHLTAEEFSDYWARVHSRLAVEAAPVLRMRRYVQNHRRDHPVGAAFRDSRGCVMGDFDGVAEAWWDSFEEMAAAAGDTPPELAAAILQDEGRFVDLARSIIWFGEERQFWPPPAG